MTIARAPLTLSFRTALIATISMLCFMAGQSSAQDQPLSPELESGSTTDGPEDIGALDAPSKILSSDEWKRTDAAVERALMFLAAQQDPDGSFPTMPYGQPAVTSLCVLAFMAHGHNPGEGPYGDRLQLAVEFILRSQKQNGLISRLGLNGRRLSRDVEHQIGVTAPYNHAISALALSELYGMNHADESHRIQRGIAKALTATLEMQRWPKNHPADRGGWRYVNDYDQTDSDLSVTGWQLMFLRSARNAGFNVPQQAIDDAVAYIRRTFNENNGNFNYRINRGDGRTRGMTGAGILALGHAGFHQSMEARRAGDALLQFSFEVYNDNQPFPSRERYHYSLFLCCQGAYQLGSPYWEKFFPRTFRAVLRSQRPNGSWDAESFHRDRKYGNSYTTALVVLSIGAPNQLLPIFQR